MRVFTYIHGIAVKAVSVAAFFAGSQAFGGGWFDIIGPHYTPVLPSSSGGAVHYEFEFYGDGNYGLSCGIVYTHVDGFTTEYATVAGNPVKNRGTVERRHRMQGGGPCGGGLYTTEFCKQSKNMLAAPPTYSPSVNSGVCSYSGGSFYESQYDNLADYVHFSPPPCLNLQTQVTSGPGWTMTFTYSANNPACYSSSSVNCSCANGSSASGFAWAWDGYYSVVVDVEAGMVGPTLPALPCPVGAGFGPNSLPVVMIEKLYDAYDNYLGGSYPGACRIWRSAQGCPPAGGLSVGFSAAGNATPGTDYTLCNPTTCNPYLNWAIIPPGKLYVDVTLQPVINTDPTEYVTLTLTPSGSYTIASPPANAATINILQSP